ncbi:hypothetical protein F4604DRAFT_1673500 [Suillus subluteus]|nr:hypothetical protein F4604DRAFT_1673500 [Suillus subluteus]
MSHSVLVFKKLNAAGTSVIWGPQIQLKIWLTVLPTIASSTLKMPDVIPMLDPGTVATRRTTLLSTHLIVVRNPLGLTDGPTAPICVCVNLRELERLEQVRALKEHSVKSNDMALFAIRQDILFFPSISELMVLEHRLDNEQQLRFTSVPFSGHQAPGVQPCDCASTFDEGSACLRVLKTVPNRRCLKFSSAVLSSTWSIALR